MFSSPCPVPIPVCAFIPVHGHVAVWFPHAR